MTLYSKSHRKYIGYSTIILVRSCFNHAILYAKSCIGAKLAFLRTTGVDIFKQQLCDAIMQVILCL